MLHHLSDLVILYAGLLFLLPEINSDLTGCTFLLQDPTFYFVQAMGDIFRSFTSR